MSIIPQADPRSAAKSEPPLAGAARPTPSGRPFPPCFLAAVLAFVTMALYWPALQENFINYDDPDYVTANHHVATGLTLDNIRWAFTTGQAANWHPLTWLSLMLDVTLFGTKAAGMHFTNMVLHAANVVLLFWLLRRLTGAPWRSAAVAAFFGWHPAHVESVAWVSERKDVLCAFFGWLTLLFYARCAQGREAGGREAESREQGEASGVRAPLSSFYILHSSFSYGLSLFCFALGLLSKPMLVTWPFVLLLLDYWPLGRLKPGRGRALVMEKMPFLALALAASVVTFVVQKQGGAVAAVTGVPLDARGGNALVSYARYLGELFWPTDLAIFYPLRAHWPVGEIVRAGVLLAGLSALAWKWRRRYPFLLMGWLWFGGTLGPVIGLVQVGRQSMADRYTYIPSVGVFIMVFWGVFELTRRWRGAQAAASVVGSAALVLCLTLTRHQLGYWRSDEILFRHDLAVAGNNFVAHDILGITLNDHGHPDAAVSEFQQALQLEPDSAEVHYNLGNALAKEGQTDAAISQFLESIRLKPAYPDAHNNLGNLLVQKGQTEAGIRQFQEAIRLDAEVTDAHYNLGNALLKTGRLDETIREFQEAIRLRPDFAPAHYNLGVALNKHGEAEAAIREFAEAVRLKPDYAIAHNSLGVALGGRGRIDEAIREFQEAVRGKPDYTNAQINLTRALALKNGGAGPLSEPVKP